MSRASWMNPRSVSHAISGPLHGVVELGADGQPGGRKSAHCGPLPAFQGGYSLLKIRHVLDLLLDTGQADQHLPVLALDRVELIQDALLVHLALQRFEETQLRSSA